METNPECKIFGHIINKGKCVVCEVDVLDINTGDVMLLPSSKRIMDDKFKKKVKKLRGHNKQQLNAKPKNEN